MQFNHLALAYHEGNQTRLTNEMGVLYKYCSSMDSYSWSAMVLWLIVQVYGVAMVTTETPYRVTVFETSNVQAGAGGSASEIDIHHRRAQVLLR
jgi:hypothetical protein